MLLAYSRRLLNDPQQQARYLALNGRPLALADTWEELASQVAFFNQPDRGIYGIAMQGKDAWIYYEWANLAFSRGGGVMSKDNGWDSDLSTSLILTEKATVDATREYLNLWRFDPSMQSTALAASSPWEQREQGKQREFLEGNNNIAFALLWSDEALRLSRARPEYAFAPIPGKVSMLAGGAFFVSRFSHAQPDAFRLIGAFLTPPAQRQLMLLGLSSPLATTYDDSIVTAAIPYAAALRASLERGVYMLEAGQDADVIIRHVAEALRRLVRLQSARNATLTAADVNHELRQAADLIASDRSRMR
jgi:ABC-type glycerol-3-phosphate transport system substrate-binding protein